MAAKGALFGGKQAPPFKKKTKPRGPGYMAAKSRKGGK